MTEWIYYLLTSGLIVVLVGVACLNLLSLPGNWLIAALSALFSWLVRTESGNGITWWVVVVLVCLAGLGEVIELVAGSAGAARRGASRRALTMSLVGSFAGSIAGAFVGLPIPVVGSAVAAIVFGAAGAFLGAFLGERPAERSVSERMSIGTAAVVGRVLGTAGKLLVGVVMVVIAAFDALI